jgi:hypothetical protein
VSREESLAAAVNTEMRYQAVLKCIHLRPKALFASPLDGNELTSVPVLTRVSSLRERQKLARLLKDEEAQASKTGGDQESRQTLSSSQTLAANDPKAQVDVKAVDRQDK